MPSTAGASPTGPDAGRDSAKEPHLAPARLHALTDHDLLDGIRRASEPHFNELYRRYFDRIYNFVYARIRNHADAEEIVQETFTVVFRSFDAYRGQSSLLSWIYGIAKNTVNNTLRKAKNQEARRESVDPEVFKPRASFSTFTPEDQLNLRRYADAINDQLKSVSSWQSEIFVMRHLENLSISEISARTDRSSDAVRSSLYRLKRLLFEAADLTATGGP